MIKIYFLQMLRIWMLLALTLSAWVMVGLIVRILIITFVTHPTLKYRRSKGRRAPTQESTPESERWFSARRMGEGASGTMRVLGEMFNPGRECACMSDRENSCVSESERVLIQAEVKEWLKQWKHGHKPGKTHSQPLH